MKYLIVVFISFLVLVGCQSGEENETMSDTDFPEMEEQEENGSNELQVIDSRQESMITISAFTASGDLEQLERALNEGLDAGLTINEINEILVQMYAYAGFPRSLNALNTFMAIVEEREAAGIEDERGPEASPLAADQSSIELGTEVQTELVGRPVTGGVFDFAPAIDEYLKGHLFGDIFGRDNLDFQNREIATIAGLANMEGVNSQLASHYFMGMNVGLTEAHLQDIISVLESEVGADVSANATQVLESVLSN